MSTQESLYLEIRNQARRSAEVKAAVEKEALEVQEYWRSVSPVDTGKYAASITVQDRSDVDGWPAKRVVAKAWYAHFIEFGTGPDTKQGSPFGPNTPTPAFAPRAKTAAHFFGDESEAEAA